MLFFILTVCCAVSTISAQCALPAPYCSVPSGMSTSPCISTGSVPQLSQVLTLATTNQKCYTMSLTEQMESSSGNDVFYPTKQGCSSCNGAGCATCVPGGGCSGGSTTEMFFREVAVGGAHPFDPRLTCGSDFRWEESGGGCLSMGPAETGFPFGSIATIASPLDMKEIADAVASRSVYSSNIIASVTSSGGVLSTAEPLILCSSGKWSFKAGICWAYLDRSQGGQSIYPLINTLPLVTQDILVAEVGKNPRQIGNPYPTLDCGCGTHFCYMCETSGFFSGIMPSTCQISGECYRSMDSKGTDACQICQPSISQTSFQVRAAMAGWCRLPNPGFPTGMKCIPENTPEVPSVPCYKCMSAIKEDVYTLDPATCLIDNQCYAAGTLRTVNGQPWPCLSCQPGVSQSAWTFTTTHCRVPRDAPPPAGEDLGYDCVPGGALRQTNTCYECILAKSLTSWTVDNTNVCDDGLRCTTTDHCVRAGCESSLESEALGGPVSAATLPAALASPYPASFAGALSSSAPSRVFAAFDFDVVATGGVEVSAVALLGAASALPAAGRSVFLINRDAGLVAATIAFDSISPGETVGEFRVKPPTSVLVLPFGFRGTFAVTEPLSAARGLLTTPSPSAFSASLCARGSDPDLAAIQPALKVEDWVQLGALRFGEPADPSVPSPPAVATLARRYCLRGDARNPGLGSDVGRAPFLSAASFTRERARAAALVLNFGHPLAFAARNLTALTASDGYTTPVGQPDLASAVTAHSSGSASALSPLRWWAGPPTTRVVVSSYVLAGLTSADGLVQLEGSRGSVSAAGASGSLVLAVKLATGGSVVVAFASALTATPTTLNVCVYVAGALACCGCLASPPAAATAGALVHVTVSSPAATAPTATASIAFDNLAFDVQVDGVVAAKHPYDFRIADDPEQPALWSYLSFALAAPTVPFTGGALARASALGYRVAQIVRNETLPLVATIDDPYTGASATAVGVASPFQVAVRVPPAGPFRNQTVSLAVSLPEGFPAGAATLVGLSASAVLQASPTTASAAFVLSVYVNSSIVYACGSGVPGFVVDSASCASAAPSIPLPAVDASDTVHFAITVVPGTPALTVSLKADARPLVVDALIGSLVLKPPPTCDIAGQCYAMGTVDPTNPCRSCDPTSTLFFWTPVVLGTPCVGCGAANGCGCSFTGLCIPKDQVDNPLRPKVRPLPTVTGTSAPPPVKPPPPAVLPLVVSTSDPLPLGTTPATPARPAGLGLGGDCLASANPRNISSALAADVRAWLRGLGGGFAASGTGNTSTYAAGTWGIVEQVINAGNPNATGWYVATASPSSAALAAVAAYRAANPTWVQTVNDDVALLRSGTVASLGTLCMDFLGISGVSAAGFMGSLAPSVMTPSRSPAVLASSSGRDLADLALTGLHLSVSLAYPPVIASVGLAGTLTFSLLSNAVRGRVEGLLGLDAASGLYASLSGNVTVDLGSAAVNFSATLVVLLPKDPTLTPAPRSPATASPELLVGLSLARASIFLNASMSGAVTVVPDILALSDLRGALHHVNGSLSRVELSGTASLSLGASGLSLGGSYAASYMRIWNALNQTTLHLATLTGLPSNPDVVVLPGLISVKPLSVRADILTSAVNITGEVALSLPFLGSIGRFQAVLALTRSSFSAAMVAVAPKTIDIIPGIAGVRLLRASATSADGFIRADGELELRFPGVAEPLGLFNTTFELAAGPGFERLGGYGNGSGPDRGPAATLDVSFVNVRQRSLSIVPGLLDISIAGGAANFGDHQFAATGQLMFDKSFPFLGNLGTWNVSFAIDYAPGAPLAGNSVRNMTAPPPKGGSVKPAWVLSATSLSGPRTIALLPNNAATLTFSSLSINSSSVGTTVKSDARITVAVFGPLDVQMTMAWPGPLFSAGLPTLRMALADVNLPVLSLADIAVKLGFDPSLVVDLPIANVKFEMASFALDLSPGAMAINFRMVTLPQKFNLIPGLVQVQGLTLDVSLPVGSLAKIKFAVGSIWQMGDTGLTFDVTFERVGKDWKLSAVTPAIELPVLAKFFTGQFAPELAMFVPKVSIQALKMDYFLGKPDLSAGKLAARIFRFSGVPTWNGALGRLVEISVGDFGGKPFFYAGMGITIADIFKDLSGLVGLPALGTVPFGVLPDVSLSLANRFLPDFASLKGLHLPSLPAPLDLTVGLSARVPIDLLRCGKPFCTLLSTLLGGLSLPPIGTTLSVGFDVSGGLSVSALGDVPDITFFGLLKLTQLKLGVGASLRAPGLSVQISGLADFPISNIKVNLRAVIEYKAPSIKMTGRMDGWFTNFLAIPFITFGNAFLTVDAGTSSLSAGGIIYLGRDCLDKFNRTKTSSGCLRGEAAVGTGIDSYFYFRSEDLFLKTVWVALFGASNTPKLLDAFLDTGFAGEVVASYSVRTRTLPNGFVIPGGVHFKGRGVFFGISFAKMTVSLPLSADVETLVLAAIQGGSAGQLQAALDKVAEGFDVVAVFQFDAFVIVPSVLTLTKSCSGSEGPVAEFLAGFRTPLSVKFSVKMEACVTIASFFSAHVAVVFTESGYKTLIAASFFGIQATFGIEVSGVYPVWKRAIEASIDAKAFMDTIFGGSGGSGANGLFEEAMNEVAGIVRAIPIIGDIIADNVKKVFDFFMIRLYRASVRAEYSMSVNSLSFGTGSVEISCDGRIFGKDRSFAIKVDLSDLSTAITAIVNDVVVPFLKSLAYARPKGELYHCKRSQEQIVVACLPNCRYGYTSVGACIETNCRSGYTDLGLFCDDSDIKAPSICHSDFLGIPYPCCHGAYDYIGVACVKIDIYTKDLYFRDVANAVGCYHSDVQADEPYSAIGPYPFVTCWANTKKDFFGFNVGAFYDWTRALY
jgi:hypothetical protein